MRRATRRARGSAPRVAHAHIPHPMIGGASLCGDVTRLVGCPVCLSRLTALLLVHVQSARKPDKSFCGTLLVGEGISPMGTAGANPSPMYVSIERAREMIAERQRSPGDVHAPICSGCELNLERFDEAHRRRSHGSAGLDSGRGMPELPTEVVDDEG